MNPTELLVREAANKLETAIVYAIAGERVFASIDRETYISGKARGKQVIAELPGKYMAMHLYIGKSGKTWNGSWQIWDKSGARFIRVSESGEVESESMTDIIDALVCDYRSEYSKLARCENNNRI